MKLENKNLLYSMLLAAVLVTFIIGYFIFMLPSLYLAQVEEENRNSVVEQQHAYIRQGSYEGVTLKNPTACCTFEIPAEGKQLQFINAYASVTMDIKDDEILDMLERVRAMFQKEKVEESETLQKEFTEYLAKYMDQMQEETPVEFTVKQQTNGEELFHDEDISMKKVEEHLFVMEFRVKDAQNQYTNYIAVTNEDGRIIVSLLPAMTSQMKEMRMTVMGSIPMIVLVIVLFVILFSYLYSRGILRPLFAQLSEKNRMLEEENKRQEVFLRASSHQLKTPISAALLLTDGMIHQIGKYSDYQIYLPKVKEKLLSMRKMTEDILYLQHSRERLQKETVDIAALIKQVIGAYGVACSEKELKVISEGELVCELETDAEMFMQIIDNLVSNAVSHAKKNSTVTIRWSQQRIQITNIGHIPEELECHIFEPFVSGHQEQTSHGLGLYIVDYYAKLLNMSVTVENTGEQVVATMLQQ